MEGPQALICQGDARHIPLGDRTVQCVVTSPPYWGLRAYKGVGDRGIGLERTPEEFVANLVEVFGEVWRVLREDGTVWLNLGDCYARSGGSGEQGATGQRAGRTHTADGRLKQPNNAASESRGSSDGMVGRGDRAPVPNGSPIIKPKDLLGLPWMVAFALRAAGWYLRSDIVWAKGVSFRPEFSGSVMPESVTDRPTRAHEYLFLLTKRERYYWNRVAAKEPGIIPKGTQGAKGSGTRDGNRRGGRGHVKADGFADVRAAQGYWDYTGLRNLRDVWAIGTKPYAEAHFATFPPGLVHPCLSIGSSPYACAACGAGWTQVLDQEPVPAEIQAQFEAARASTVASTGRTDGHTQRKPNYVREVTGAHWEPTCRCGTTETTYQIVLDPFAGSGTVGEVALALGRYSVLLDASHEYCQLARRRCGLDAPVERERETARRTAQA